MDDTNWIASSKDQLENTLGITREFNELNNILVNDDKAELMTTEVVEITNPNNKDEIIALPITLAVGGSHNIIITPLKKSQSAKFLGVQISLHCNKPYVKFQVAHIVKCQYNIMRRKSLTDKLLEYIFNQVVGPQIEYITQLTIFTLAECHAICSPIRTLFKHKMSLAISAPNQYWYGTMSKENFNVLDMSWTCPIQVSRPNIPLYSI